MKNYIQFQ